MVLLLFLLSLSLLKPLKLEWFLVNSCSLLFSQNLPVLNMEEQRNIVKMTAKLKLGTRFPPEFWVYSGFHSDLLLEFTQHWKVSPSPTSSLYKLPFGWNYVRHYYYMNWTYLICFLWIWVLSLRLLHNTKLLIILKIYIHHTSPWLTSRKKWR